MVQRLKRLPGMQETQVRSLGWEDPLEKEMATHSSTLAWRIPWREEPGKLQSLGCKESDTTERLHFTLSICPETDKVNHFSVTWIQEIFFLSLALGLVLSLWISSLVFMNFLLLSVRV